MAAADLAASLDSRALSMKPCVELLPAAVMIADITGFTAREPAERAGGACYKAPACVSGCNAAGHEAQTRRPSSSCICTRLAVTEALSTKGSAGVELLTKCMNRYFSQACAGLACCPAHSQHGGFCTACRGGSPLAGWLPWCWERSTGRFVPPTFAPNTCRSSSCCCSSVETS